MCIGHASNGETYLKKLGFFFSSEFLFFRRIFIHTKINWFLFSPGCEVSIGFNFILSTRLGLGRYLLAIWQIFISFWKIRCRHLEAVGRQDKTWAYFFDNQQTYFHFIDDFPPKGSRDGPKFCASSISCHAVNNIGLVFLSWIHDEQKLFLAKNLCNAICRNFDSYKKIADILTWLVWRHIFSSAVVCRWGHWHSKMLCISWPRSTLIWAATLTMALSLQPK